MSKDNRKKLSQKRGSSRKTYFSNRAKTAKKGSKGRVRFEQMLGRHGLKR